MKTIRFRARHKGSVTGWTPWSDWSYVHIYPIEETWMEINRVVQDVYVTPDGLQLTEPPEDDVYVELKRITQVTFERPTDKKHITQIFDHSGTY